MPRITLTADTSAGRDEPAVLLDEHVQSVHLASGHSAAQLIERLAWAILDAEQQDDRTPKPVRAHEPDLRSQHQENRQAFAGARAP